MVPTRLEVVVDDAAAVLVQVGQSLEDLGHDHPGLLLRQQLQIHNTLSATTLACHFQLTAI